MGWDYGKPRIQLPAVNAIYVSREGNLAMRNAKLLYTFHKEIKSKQPDVIFANYTRGISIVKLLNRKSNFILDIRTLSVNKKSNVRLWYNTLLKFELSFFKEISVISEGVARLLKLKNYYLLPLGGECFCTFSKSFDKLAFLYVGTFENRNMIKCIEAFHLYLAKNTSREPPPTFTIIGGPDGAELAEVKRYIKEHNLENQIITTGPLRQDQLRPFFEQANIGISYIPIKPYYDFQPSTKTFEYLISGLPVIATTTHENSKIVDHSCGILAGDSVEAFADGLNKIETGKDRFNSDFIRRKYKQYSWKYIVKNYFLTMINKIAEVNSQAEIDEQRSITGRLFSKER